MSHVRKRHYLLKLSLFFGVIAVLLLIALTSFWAQRTLFDTDNFTATTTRAVSEESSRQAIGELVATRVFEKTPILGSLLSDRLAGHVAGLLGTERAQASVNRLAREAQLVITSPQREPVTIDLTGLKSAIVSVQDITGRTGNDVLIDADSIPDKVMLIDTASLPNIHHLAIVIVWLGPLTLLLALGLMAWWVLCGRKVRMLRLLYILTLVISVAVLAIVIGLIAEPSFVALGSDVSSQTLLCNLYEAFMSSFYRQAMVLGSVSAVLLVGLTIWRWFTAKYSVKVAIIKR